METKLYTHEEIEVLYSKLTCKKREMLLWEALDYMQEYNGRSKFRCIALALGYDNIEGGRDTYIKR